MKIKNYQSVTQTYKEHNEDRFGASNYGFWVIDGALPLSHAHHTDSCSDVVWMVTWWNDYLGKYLDDFNRTIVEIMEEGVDQINQEFNRFYDVDKLTKLDRASASIAIVRLNDSTLETLVLGDVEVNLETCNGDIITIVDDSMSEMDNQVINMIFDNPERSGQVVFNGYTHEELEILRYNRMTMNEPGGYTVLEHDRAAIKNGIYKCLSLSDLKSVLIMSDGYSAVYNKYELMSQEVLMTTWKTQSLEIPLNIIRQAESEDLDFNTYKRLRKHDDATAVGFEIVYK